MAPGQPAAELRGMDDLSLHILDVAENSLAAGATRIDIVIEENSAADLLRVEVADNGRGMSAGEVGRAIDPFYTTRTTRRVGLGLPLLDGAARAAGGMMVVRSAPGEGTVVVATFMLSHIDRKPLGNMGETIAGLIAALPGLELTYRHERDGKLLLFTTEDIRRRLGGEPLNTPDVLQFIRDYVAQEETSLSTNS